MRKAADLILQGAKVYTVDSRRPWAEAIAISDGSLLAVGTNEDVQAFRGGETEVRDLGGNVVFPGLVDVHLHPLLAGKADLYELTFPGSASFDEILDAVREYAARMAPDQWIVGSSWGVGLRDELSREDSLRRLDAASLARPVLLTDESHHNRYVNTRALQAASITENTPDPVSGRIVRDAETGALTGLMIEGAGLLVEQAARRADGLSRDQYEAALARGVELANSYGITAFQDAAIDLGGLRALKALDDRGALTAWVVSSMTVNDQALGYTDIGDELIARGEQFRSEHHRPDFVKIFLDGTPGTYSAAVLDPYLPSTEFGADFHGHTTMPADELEGWLMKTAQRGLGAKVHCTGDASVRMVLDAVESVRRAGYTELRYHIAHGQFISEHDVPRMAELGVVADISPFLWFPGAFSGVLRRVLSPRVIDRIHPNRTLWDSGVLIAGGSDWPVAATPNAWEGIYGLVTRSDPRRRYSGASVPGEALSIEQAIKVFTINAATAMGMADVTGSLRAGKSADFVVLDRNPLSVHLDDLAQTTVQETWFSGRRVY